MATVRRVMRICPPTGSALMTLGQVMRSYNAVESESEFED